MRINYQSDFKLSEHLNTEVITPFTFTYYLKGGNNAEILTASFDGSEFVNCKLYPNNILLVPFDGVNKTGIIYVKREYYLTDKDFKDGICNYVSNDNLNIELVYNKADYKDITTEVCPFYQQGEAMTWEKMTVENKNELKNLVLDSLDKENLANADNISDLTEYKNLF